MPNRPAGPPPVARSAAIQPSGETSPLARNYLTIINTLKADGNAEAKAIRAMFGGDKALMDRFLAVAFSSLQGNADLILNADPMTIVQAIKDAAALGLEPTGLGGEGVIVRYGRQAKFMPMWRGYLKRIRNSGKVAEIDCQVVYMNDEFSIALGTDPSIHHVPVLYGERDEESGQLVQERGGYRGFYAWALMPSGIKIIEYLSVDDINAIRDRYAESYRNPDKRDSSPWVTAYGEQARKTVIRRLSKRLPGEAVDHLLRLDAMADQAAGEAKALATEAMAGVSEVRRLALAAVGLERPEATTGETTGPVATTEAADASSSAVEANGTVPDADAATAGTALSSQPDTCSAASPYPDGGSCVKVEGHAGNHASADRATWA